MKFVISLYVSDVKSYLHVLSRRAPIFQSWFRHVREDVSDRVNSLLESVVYMGLGSSEDLEKSSACHEIDMSIKSIQQDFDHYCNDMLDIA